jgi:hypothetical protein
MGGGWEECLRLKPARDFYFSPYPRLEPALSVVEGSWANFVSPLRAQESVVSCWWSVVRYWVSATGNRRSLDSAGCPILVRFCGQDGREWEECRRLKPARDFHFSRYPGLTSWANFVLPFGLKNRLSVVGGQLSVTGSPLPETADPSTPLGAPSLSAFADRMGGSGKSAGG